MLLSSLIRNRPICVALSSTGMVHLGLVALDLPSWECPIWHRLGVPCPSCGLSRAIAALIQGDMVRALTIHAFAPIAVLVMMLVIYASVVSKHRRMPLSRWLERIERKTCVSAIALGLFLIYWLVRLLFFKEAFYLLLS